MTGPPIGIALGDVTGIGPEVTLKALSKLDAGREDRYVILGDLTLLRRLNESLGTRVPLKECPAGGIGSGWGTRFGVLDPRPEPLSVSLAPGAGDASRAAVEWLQTGARLCLEGQLSALVTAPVNKAAIIRSGQQGFVGQTEFLSAIAGTDQTIMMLLGADDRGRWLRVALATTHVPLRRVAESLTAERVRLAVRRAAEACQLLGLARARVGMCGLNPHAGEGGEMGREEIDFLQPLVAELKADGLDVTGPLPADTLFHQAYRGDFEAVVAMYHDQGLAPLKMVCFDTGVNWTLGLPFIRTSPDHGTAYDIAGRGTAHSGSMEAALRLARTLSARPDAPVHAGAPG